MRGRRIADLDILKLITYGNYMVIETPSGTFKILVEDIRDWMHDELIPDVEAKIPEIVDNCVDGGRDKTLSAEQGKILMNNIKEILAELGNEELNTTAKTIKGAINEVNNKEFRVDNIKYEYVTKPNIHTIKDALDYLLYEVPVITMNHNKTLINEKGAIVENVVFTWSYEPNLILSQTFNGESIDRELRNFTIPEINSDIDVKLVAKDQYNTISKTISFKFYNGVYYGVGDNSQTISNLTKELRPDRLKTFTVNATSGNYIYFAIPSSYGTPAFFVGGFEGGFTKIRTESFTNASGFAENYDVYKSNQADLGNTTVTVK